MDKVELIFNEIRIQIRLLQLYKEVDSDSLITYLCHINNLSKSDYYQDYQPGQNHLIAEFIGMYYMFQPRMSKSITDYDQFMIIVSEFQKLSERLISIKSMLRLCNNRVDIFDQENIDALSNKIRRDSAVVKNPGFPFHHEEIMAELFSHYKIDLRTAIGFDYDDVLQVIRAVPVLIEDRMTKAYRSIFEKVQQQVNDIKYYRKKKRVRKGSVLIEEVILQYRTISNAKLLEIVKINNVELHVKNSIDGYSFDSLDIAEYVDLPPEVIKIILDTFSAENGDWIYFPDTSYGLVPFVEKPYLKVKSKYIVPSIRNITWAASIKFEKVLKNHLSRKRFEKHKKYRHDFLLSKSLDFLRDLMFDLDFLYENCYYRLNENRCEVDGLLKIDNVLFVIEFKSHDLSDSARTGYNKRVEKHINNIILDAYQQAQRVIKFISIDEVSEFELENSSKFQLKFTDFDRVIPVVITLAQLGHITTGLKKTDTSKYFEEEQYPWIVNIYDLKIICDLCRNSSELVDYVIEREKFLEETKMSIYDELDIFSYYQTRSLNSFRNMPDYENYDWGYLENATDEINHYYLNKYGDYYKEKVDKPQLKIPKLIVSLTNQVIKQRFKNRIDFCLHLYNIDIESIERFSKYFSKLVKNNRRSRGHHDFTITSKDHDGLNIAISVVIDSNIERLQRVCDFILSKRLSDSKIKEGFMLKVIGSKKSYKVIGIEKYATNIAESDHATV